MVYSFARVSAVVGMCVEDYYQQGKRWWLRLQEKGGKHHAVPVHHKAEAALDAYLAAAGIAAEKDAPLWRSMPRAGGLSPRRMSRVDVFRMIKRRVTDHWARRGELPHLPGHRHHGLSAQWRHARARPENRRA